jgi:hypothetical protein
LYVATYATEVAASRAKADAEWKATMAAELRAKAIAEEAAATDPTDPRQMGRAAEAKASALRAEHDAETARIASLDAAAAKVRAEEEIEALIADEQRKILGELGLPVPPPGLKQRAFGLVCDPYGGNYDDHQCEARVTQARLSDMRRELLNAASIEERPRVAKAIDATPDAEIPALHAELKARESSAEASRRPLPAAP